MQVGLDKQSIRQLQSLALVRAEQASFNISFNVIKIFSISSGVGRRNAISQLSLVFFFKIILTCSIKVIFNLINLFDGYA